MRRLNIDYPVAVAALIGLLLIAYVFAGGARRQSDPQLRCASPHALDQIKGELFRRASIVRGKNDPGFVQTASYAVLRASSQVLRDRKKSGTVNCSASMVLDLPPGVQVAGGRRSLGAKLSYAFATSSAGKAQLRTLNNADPIVQPLATVGSVGVQPAVPAMTLNSTNGVEHSRSDETIAPAVPVVRAPGPALVSPAPRARPVTRTVSSPRAKPSPAAGRSVADARPAARSIAPAPRVNSEAPVGAARSTIAPPGPQPLARPSFNCRYARTRGETAVCRNPGLASLDRQMSQRFYSALAVASPGAKQLLQRSRNRFLRSRDSCRSEECIAAAYHARIAEIGDIMSRF